MEGHGNTGQENIPTGGIHVVGLHQQCSTWSYAWDTMDCVSGAWPQEQQQQEVTWSLKEKATQVSAGSGYRCLSITQVLKVCNRRAWTPTLMDSYGIKEMWHLLSAAKPKDSWPHSFPAASKPPSHGWWAVLFEAWITLSLGSVTRELVRA